AHAARVGRRTRKRAEVAAKSAINDKTLQQVAGEGGVSIATLVKARTHGLKSGAIPRRHQDHSASRRKAFEVLIEALRLNPSARLNYRMLTQGAGMPKDEATWAMNKFRHMVRGIIEGNGRALVPERRYARTFNVNESVLMEAAPVITAAIRAKNKSIKRKFTRPR
ncbi:MAG: hypothetical protein JXB14_02945, partial [Candidatus Altiarchaeota archaeon]|nr:hypothetical protein [Candidatus Altiarchaeota archaeon]